MVKSRDGFPGQTIFMDFFEFQVFTCGAGQLTSSDHLLIIHSSISPTVDTSLSRKEVNHLLGNHLFNTCMVISNTESLPESEEQPMY